MLLGVTSKGGVRFRTLLFVLAAGVVTGTTVIILLWGFSRGLLFAAAGALCIYWIIWNRNLDALFMPTTIETARRMLQMACIQPGEVVFDLGCGDGRLVAMAAKDYGAEAIGVEIDPTRVLLSRLRLWLSGARARARIVRGDIYQVNLSTADVVLLYLSPAANQKLQTKLLKELRPTARVVSNYHPMPGWQPDDVRPSAKPGEQIYLYRIGRCRPEEQR